MFSSIFRSSVPIDFSFIGVDMHSHMLPGIDDGAVTVEESLSYFKAMQEWGYHKCICTPHIFRGVHNNSADTILPALEKMRAALAEAAIALSIDAAAEYMVDESFMDLLNNNTPLLTIAGKYILIEMSYAAPSPYLENAIFKLNIQGYKPILAHPERYSYFHHQLDYYDRLLEMGCIFQVNLLSLSGYYGMPVKKFALKMLKQNMFALIGTDLHHHNHKDAIKAFAVTKECYEIIRQIPLLNQQL